MLGPEPLKFKLTYGTVCTPTSSRVRWDLGSAGGPVSSKIYFKRIHCRPSEAIDLGEDNDNGNKNNKDEYYLLSI